MNNQNSSSDSSFTFFSPKNLIIIALVIFSYLILFFEYKMTEINWGIDQLSYFSNGFYILWIILSVLSVVLLLFDVKRHFISDFLNSYLWGERKILGRILVLILAAVIFYLFRFEAYLYGDGYIRVANFAQKNVPIFKWFEFGSTIVPFIFYQVLFSFGLSKLAAAIAAYQIVSIGSGIIFIYFIMKISDRLYDNHHDKITSLLLIIFSGLSMMFLGLVENYSILLAVGAAFYYQMQKIDKSASGKNLLVLWVIAAAGIFLHIMCLVLIPVTIYLSVRFFIIRRRAGFSVGLTAGLLSMIAAVVLLYILAGNNIFIKDHILLLKGKSPEAYYWLFSKRHFADIFNLLYLFIPLFPIFLMAVILDLKNLKKVNMVTILFLFALAQIILVLVIDPKDGMAREIPLFGFLLMAFVFRGVYSIINLRKNLNISRAVIMGLCPAALILVIPGILTHISLSKSEASINKFIKYNEFKAKTAIVALRDCYVVAGDQDKANEYDQMMEGKSPGALQSRLVNDLYARERYDEAFGYTNQLVDRYPYEYFYRIQRSNLLKHYKRFGEAEAELDTALMLAPYSIEPYHYLSELYRESKQERKCIAILEKAVTFAPDNVILLIDLTGYYYRTKVYDSADGIARVAISIDSLSPYPYMYRGLIADNFGQTDQAVEFFNKFISLNDALPEVPIIRKRLNAIYLRQREGKLSDSL